MFQQINKNFDTFKSIWRKNMRKYYLFIEALSRRWHDVTSNPRLHFSILVS